VAGIQQPLAQQLGAFGRLVDDQDAHQDAVAFCLLCISAAILP
jgi:hypothetical protein